MTKVRKILIIDDDKMVRDTLKLMLQAVGHTLAFAADGRQGIKAPRAARSDQRLAQRLDRRFLSKAQSCDLHFTALHCTTGRTACQER